MTEAFRLGSKSNEWTQEQIDDFLDELGDEIFDSQSRTAPGGGGIVGLTREDSDGNRTKYVKEDGEWSEV